MIPQSAESTLSVLSAEPLLQLLVGFQKSQVLMTAQQLGIFTGLNAGESTSAELCQALSIPARSGERLLQACAALGLLECHEGKFRNSSMVERYLVPEAPAYLGGLVDYYREAIYPSCGRLSLAVREDRPQVMQVAPGGDVFTAMEKDRELGRRFTKAMHSLGLLEGHRLARLYPFEDISSVLDIGGGSGALGIALAQAHQHLRVTLLDRPPVCELAKDYIAAAHLEDRIHLVPSDFWRDAWPTDADAILFSMILHDWSPVEGLRLLQHAFEALPSGGRVMIYEQLLEEDRCGPPVACLANLTMLLRTSGGSESTVTDYTHLLGRAGFDRIQVYRSSGLRHLMTATKP